MNFNQTLAKELAAKTQATVVPFSTTEKVDGAYLEGNMLTFRGEPVMAADELGVPGSHNVENALATIAVAKLRGIENQVIKETLAGFGGVSTAFNMSVKSTMLNFITIANPQIFLQRKRPCLVLTIARLS